ncbi:hypothetical protein [Teichococcus vastitatis]|uniref:Uncharacterized protein n=1 Tax=Teichococcus vastitatis TaxID=2307076 RepID=A0ABS9W994_9PROT|nr:hypothetical protein [Pseudoroseomonas vastitatis]MCI0755871.1 hypothetical protein [Pseudoroseomonas vastitatis]
MELRAADSTAPVAWASERLGRPVRVPDLSDAGYRLMGGRLVPTAQGAALLLMFDDDQGNRLVLLTRPMAQECDTIMAHRDAGTVHAYTWAMAGNGYSRSCPIAWCRSDGFRRAELPDQAGTAESLTLAVSLTALMASRVM